MLCYFINRVREHLAVARAGQLPGKVTDFPVGLAKGSGVALRANHCQQGAQSLAGLADFVNT